VLPGDRILGSRVVGVRNVDRGYTHQVRCVARLEDGRTVFVKQAVDSQTAEWLEAERAIYEAVHAPFIATMLGWIENPPTLILEDLSDATWPPPWNSERIEAVYRGLEALASNSPPPVTTSPIAEHRWAQAPGWAAVAGDPSEFLALRVCSPRWFERAIPHLVAAEAAAPLAGESLLHGDIRSDNLCLRNGHAVFVDWNIATVGNPVVDIAFWLPSLAAEGGPTPDQSIVPMPPELAAFVAGFFAVRAGQPAIPHAPLVRQVQRAQLEVALPWAARQLALPPPT
jgi:hypothetical protein